MGEIRTPDGCDASLRRPEAVASPRPATAGQEAKPNLTPPPIVEIFSIVAHPNSRKPRIEKDTKGTLHVYVAVRPQDGKANEHIITALARHLGIAPSLIRITKGLRGKQKTIQIQ